MLTIFPAETVVLLHALSTQIVGNSSEKNSLSQKTLVSVYFCSHLFALIGSTPQGLTKAETIQVKGDE